MSADNDKKKKKRARPVIDGDYQEPEFIEIEVTDPVTKDGFTSYRINTRTTFPEYKNREFSVRRRYKEFAWLRGVMKDRLAEKPKASKFGELPSLPGNTVSSLFGQGRFDGQFIEDRRKGLQLFINAVAQHNYFRFQPEVHKFLEDESATFD